MKRALVGSLLALGLCGCESTSSTEVGVRTNLLGVIEKRGEQQIYPAGGAYLVAPLLNAWDVLLLSQQNLAMNANMNEGDRPVPDDITFKTKDGNNVHIDVNVMWRVNPQKAGEVITRVGGSAEEIKERVVRPIARSAIRDAFNTITSEEYYQVAMKNQVAQRARDLLAKELEGYGLVVDSLQVQQHRFDPEYQEAINAQKQAEADVQTLLEQQKNIVVQKASELEAKRAEWNRRLEEARGRAGSIRNEADGYFQTQSNAAKAVLARARAESDATRKEAEALNRLGGDAYVKMQLAKQFAGKRILLVPATNVSTVNVNDLVGAMMGEQQRQSVPSKPDASASQE